MLLSAMILVFLLSLPVVIPFYLFHVRLGLAVQLIAAANFFIVAGIWVACLFLTALKDYNKISIAFGTAVMYVRILKMEWTAEAGPCVVLGLEAPASFVFDVQAHRNGQLQSQG